MRDKEDEYETESEEEIDIIDEANSILEILEELEEERKNEDKILKQKEVVKELKELKNIEKSKVKNNVKEIRKVEVKEKKVESVIIESDKIDKTVMVEEDLANEVTEAPDLKSNNTREKYLLSPSTTIISLEVEPSPSSSTNIYFSPKSPRSNSNVSTYKDIALVTTHEGSETRSDASLSPKQSLSLSLMSPGVTNDDDETAKITNDVDCSVIVLSDDSALESKVECETIVYNSSKIDSTKALDKDLDKLVETEDALPHIDLVVDMLESQSIQVESQSNDASSFPLSASFIPQIATTMISATESNFNDASSFPLFASFIPHIATTMISATESNFNVQNVNREKLAGVGTAGNCLMEDDLPEKLADGNLYKVGLPDHKISIKSYEKVQRKKNVKIKDRKKVDRGELDVIFDRIREKRKIQNEKNSQKQNKETEEIKAEDKNTKKVAVNSEAKESVNINKKKIQSSLSKWVKVEKEIQNDERKSNVIENKNKNGQNDEKIDNKLA